MSGDYIACFYLSMYLQELKEKIPLPQTQNITLCSLAFVIKVTWNNEFCDVSKGIIREGPPSCKPFLTKQPTTSKTCHKNIKLKHGMEINMTIWRVPSLWQSATPPLKNSGYAPVKHWKWRKWIYASNNNRLPSNWKATTKQIRILHEPLLALNAQLVDVIVLWQSVGGWLNHGYKCSPSIVMHGLRL